MPDVFIPTWQDVQGLASAAKSQLLICTPYYSEEGVGRDVGQGVEQSRDEAVERGEHAVAQVDQR